MVAVPTGVPSARTVALVLAVLGYRRRLRRRDRWSRAALLAHQDRALRRLREHAYQKSRFYQDCRRGRLRLKGFDSPMPAFEVVWRTSESTPRLLRRRCRHCPC
jgi:hypothetical protein